MTVSAPHPSPQSVVPRVLDFESGEPIPIDQAVLVCREQSELAVEICGNGKSTAIEYLRTIFEEDERVELIDNVHPQEAKQLRELPGPKFVIFASADPSKESPKKLQLAAWCDDDLIEYLLKNHAGDCRSVMQRVTNMEDRMLAANSPFVWSAVLDLMVEDPRVETIEQAIGLLFNRELTAESQKQVSELCVLKRLRATRQELSGLIPQANESLARLLSIPTVQWVVAAERFLEMIEEQCDDDVLAGRWPHDFYHLLAGKTHERSGLIDALNEISSRDNSPLVGLAASLMVQIDPHWRPKVEESTGLATPALNLSFANLDGARWNKMDLSDADLTACSMCRSRLGKANLRGAIAAGADLGQAELSGASLDGLRAYSVNFAGANLSKAVGSRPDFTGSDFSRANLFESRLPHANFSFADLGHANLAGSKLDHAVFKATRVDECNFQNSSLRCATMQNLDLARARLDGALLAESNLIEANLEGLSLAHAYFFKAILRRALLTDSRFRNCDLSKVNLIDAKLAGIDWEGCVLRGADFSHCHFHFGSCRSGLVGSPYPSHGTRTGFYDEDLDQLSFRPVEEIRLANLRGCDLVGAHVLQADFYRVDLRDAIYDDRQAMHFKRTGAILS